MAKKKTIVATGRVGNPEVKTLDQVEAERKFASFGAETKEEYNAKLEKMTTFDLSTHAFAMGIRPGSERSRIKQALLTSFESARAAVKVTSGRAAAEATVFNQDVTDNYESFIAKFNASKLASA